MARRLPIFAALLAGVALAVSPALSPGDDDRGKESYGRGLFTGNAESASGEDRPRTPVSFKVKGDRIRALQLVFLFDCDSAALPVRAQVATRFVKIRARPKGGKAFLTHKYADPAGGPKLDLTLRMVIEQRKVRGTAEAMVFVDKMACRDEVEFSAKKRG